MKKVIDLPFLQLFLLEMFNSKLIFILGLVSILIGIYCFNPNPIYENYKYEIWAQSREAIVNNLHFNFNFPKKEVTLNFSIHIKGEDYIEIDYPLVLDFKDINILNESTPLHKGKDYDVKILNQSDNKKIYRKFLVITPKRNLSWEDIGITFDGNLYPEGSFFISVDTANVRDKIVNSNIPGIKRERVNMVLGDYLCENPCVANTLPWQDNDFGYYIVPSKNGPNIKIVYKSESEQKVTSFILNTYNDKNKNIREFLLAIGVSFISGAIILVINSQSQQNDTRREYSQLNRNLMYACRICRRNHYFTSAIGRRHNSS